MLDIITTINRSTASFFQGGLISFFISSLVITIITIVSFRITKRLLLKKYGDSIIFIIRILKIIFITIAGIALTFLIIPFRGILTTALTSTGIIVLVLGFAAQEAVANIVGGFFITFFKPFTIGDLITIVDSNLTGYVEDLSLRHTTIRTYTSTLIVVPNSIINKSVLENLSLTGAGKGNFLEIGVAYDTNLELAMSIMKEIVEAHPYFVDIRSEEDLIQDVPKSIVRLSAFTDSAMTLRTLFHTENASKGVAMLSDCRIAIKHAFDAHGIEIPFPQSVVTLKKEQ